MMQKAIWKLVQEYNNTLGQATLPSETLKASFDAAWPQIEAKLKNIWQLDVPSSPVEPPEAIPQNNQNPSKSRVRISSFDQLCELWPHVLMRIRKRIGVTAVAYLHDAQPIAFDDEQVVLEFTKPFHYEKASDAMKRLPFQDTLNEIMDKPRTLKFVLKAEGQKEA